MRGTGNRHRGHRDHTPVRLSLQLEGTLASRLSRGLWLVKWLLAIPQCSVLFSPVLNWLTVAQLHAINRAKVHQLQALSATTGDLT